MLQKLTALKKIAESVAGRVSMALAQRPLAGNWTSNDRFVVAKAPAG
jgi:hypothetical protein